MVSGPAFRHPRRMTSSQHTPFADHQAPEPAPGWSRRFSRSSRDRKIAGVAGGLGRALGVDPVLIRVGFAVLTIFGGSGVALYALGWLLLPSDRDEVSALDGLLGRGRSSVSPLLAVILGLVVVGSITSTFTVGLPLLPIAIAAAIVFGVVGKRRGRDWRYAGGGDRFGRQMQEFAERAAHWGDEVGRRAGRWGDDFGRRAEQWGQDVGHRAEHWSGHFGCGGNSRRRHQGWYGPRPDNGLDLDPAAPPAASPFDRPAFWDDHAGMPVPDPGTRRGGAAPVDLRKGRTDPTDSDPTNRAAADPVADTDPSAMASAASSPSSPPAWDPLGAAPFAWDLPEPGPAPASPEQQARGRRTKAFARATVGVALIVGAVLALGLSVGWWQMSWAAISASALAVLAVGIFFSAIRGRRSRLIGAGIVLSIVTAVLTLTGLDGSNGFGGRQWIPQSFDQVDRQYRLGAGDATLDLSNVEVPERGELRSVAVDLNAGNLTVIVPDDANVTANCSANLGHIDCLGQGADGMVKSATATGPTVAGKSGFALDVHVGAGNLEVRRG